MVNHGYPWLRRRKKKKKKKEEEEEEEKEEERRRIRRRRKKKEEAYVCTRICVYKKRTHMCVHAHVCTRLYTHMCVHAYTRICVYTHIHGYVCMCVRVNAKSLHMRLSKRAAWPTPWNGWPKVRHGPWVGHGQKNGHPKHLSGNCKPFGVQPTPSGPWTTSAVIVVDARL